MSFKVYFLHFGQRFNNMFNWSEETSLFTSHRFSDKCFLKKFFYFDWFSEITIFIGPNIWIMYMDSCSSNKTNLIKDFQSITFSPCCDQLSVKEKIEEIKDFFSPILLYCIEKNAFKCFKFALINGADPSIKSEKLKRRMEWKRI